MIIKSRPSVSVIVPSYNYGSFIHETIEAILSQSVKVDEIIIVDDGSEDDTETVCSRYPEVKYIWKENGGVSTARNVGLEASSSEYIVFPDADDLMYESMIDDLFSAIELAPVEVGAVFGRANFFTKDGVLDNIYMPSSSDIEPYFSNKISESVYLLNETFIHRLVKSSVVPQCSSMIKKTVYNSIGMWDERFKYHQDRHMWLKIASKYKVVFVDKVVAGIRRHDNNITHKDNWIRNHLEILELLKDVQGSEWADVRLSMLAKKYYSSGAYNISQRYADNEDYSNASKYMLKALCSNTSSIKSLLRYLQYKTKSLF